jgi:hypothetical protein
MLPNPVESLYLTPKVVETALEAGVIAFSGSGELRKIYERIAVNLPECLPHHTHKNNLLYVARWFGRLSWLGMGKESDFAHAAADQSYLAASRYYVGDGTAADVAAANGWVTKNELLTDPNKTIIDIIFRSWDKPNFGKAVVIGLTPRPANVTTQPLITPTGETTYIDLRDQLRRELSEEFPNPFSILRPPGKPYKKPPEGKEPLPRY